MAKTDLGTIAFAEIILNRTLSYQAALAVHELKDWLNLDVEELRLVVSPLREDMPGKYCVTCTIESLGSSKPITVEVVVEPEKAIEPVSPRKKKNSDEPFVVDNRRFSQPLGNDVADPKKTRRCWRVVLGFRCRDQRSLRRGTCSEANASLSNKKLSIRDACATERLCVADNSGLVGFCFASMRFMRSWRITRP